MILDLLDSLVDRVAPGFESTNVSETLAKAREYAYFTLFENLETSELRSTLVSISYMEEIPSAKTLRRILHGGSIHEDTHEFVSNLVSAREEIVQLIAHVEKNGAPHEIRGKLLSYLNSSLAILDLNVVTKGHYDEELGRVITRTKRFPHGHTHVSYHKALIDNLRSDNLDLYAFALIYRSCADSDELDEARAESMMRLALGSIVTGERSMERLREFEKLMRKLMPRIPESLQEEIEQCFDEIFTLWIIQNN